MFLCFLAYLVERRLQLGLASLSEKFRPDWKEALDSLREWRRITISTRPDLKGHFSSFTTTLANWLTNLGIPIPMS